MKHHAFAAMGLLTAALLVPGAPSHAASADPTGFWVKPGSERNAKIEVRKCGRGICAKIVWLEDPKDSKGRPLRDVRNENPSLRGRSIVGLPLFSGLAPSAPGVWTGKIYNPEDGGTYSVTLTVVSRQQLKLKGCKGWVMCGERVWLRTSPPPVEPKPDETIEASVKPDTEKAEAPAVTEAKAETPAPEPATPMGLAQETEMVAGAAPQAAVPQAAAEPMSPEQHARSGYRLLNASVTPETARYSGEDVLSMFDMTNPVAAAAAPAAPATQAAIETESSVPPPSPKPKPSLQASAAKPPLKPASQPKPVKQAAPAPQETAPDADADIAGTAETESETQKQQAAVDESVSQPPLTRRQKRLLRRQRMGQRPLFPWLRSN
ncbi:MAG: DUF2147 domain-containing protein [Methyloceanibacter sp.]